MTIKQGLVFKEQQYGRFADHAEAVVALRQTATQIMSKKPRQVTCSQVVALDMIVFKLARILGGDMDYVDSWRDIAGYATLVVEELERSPALEHDKEDAPVLPPNSD